MDTVENRNIMETNYVQKETTYNTECKHVMYSTEFSG